MTGRRCSGGGSSWRPLTLLAAAVPGLLLGVLLSAFAVLAVLALAVLRLPGAAVAPIAGALDRLRRTATGRHEMGEGGVLDAF